jgi:hypothetical protein
VNQYLWQPTYEAAMLETETTLIKLRITEAENALIDRLEDDIHGRCVLDLNERQAIDNARRLLAVLRRTYAA